MLSCLNYVWFCVTLWIIASQAPLSTVFSRQEYWSGLSCSPPGDLPDPGMEPESLMSPALAGGFFTTSTMKITYLKNGKHTGENSRDGDSGYEWDRLQF